jgi:hypothetical protein
LLKKERQRKTKQNKSTTAQIGTNVKARREFGARLLARSRFASGRRPANSIAVFRGPRANAELVPKFHVALHASHAALRMETLEISPYTNVTLTFVPCSWGIWVREPYTEKNESNWETKKLKSDHGPHWGPGTKKNWPTDHRSQYNLKLNLRHSSANDRPVLSSERAAHINKPAIV